MNSRLLPLTARFLIGAGVALLALVVLAALAGTGERPTVLEATATDGSTPVPGPPVGTDPTTTLAPEPNADGDTGADVAAEQAPTPTTVRIPRIGVDATMIPLGLNDDGTIEVPHDFAQTGWWADGPEPGEAGPAVILGHVDSRSGPAVFYDLRSLDPGDEILVDRLDGTTVTYAVERLEQHPKDDFPTQAVYGPTDGPELRLVTCGGDFDRDARSYRDNVIVFASLA